MSSFINFNNRDASAETKYSAKVIKRALLKTETKSSVKAESLVKNIQEPVALNEALVFFTDKLGAIKVLNQAIVEEGNAFGAARAEAIAKGEKEFTVDGETYPVEDVDQEDKENAEEFVEEKYDKKGLLKALGKNDDGIILVKGQEYIIYNPDNGNADNTDMWGEETIIALNRDGDEVEFKYSDIERFDEAYDGNMADFRYEFPNQFEEVTGNSSKAIKKISKKGKGFEVRTSSYMSEPEMKAVGDAMNLSLVSYEKSNIVVAVYESNGINENYEVIFSDGISQMKKFRSEQMALDFMKKEIKANKKLRDIAVYKPGMHSTTQTELVVAFWGNGSYLDNVSKRDPKLAAKKVEEAVVNELSVGTYRDTVKAGIARGDSKGEKIANTALESFTKEVLKELASQEFIIKATRNQAVAVANEIRRGDNKNQFNQFKLVFTGEGSMINNKNIRVLGSDEVHFNAKAYIYLPDTFGGWSSDFTLRGYQQHNHVPLQTVQFSIKEGKVWVYFRAGDTQFEFTRPGARMLAQLADKIAQELEFPTKVKHNSISQFDAMEISANESVDVNEGRSINKIQKEWNQVTTDMLQKVEAWKAAEGDRKTEILEELKTLTARKKALEAELEDAVAGKDKDVQLAVSEGNAFLAARAKAIEEDAEEFEFNGKTYPVIKEGNAFGAARAEAIAKGEKEFEVDGEKFPVEDVSKEDEENAEEFVGEAIEDNWKYLLERFAITNEDLRADLKKYIKDNKKEIDALADQDNWDGIYDMLMNDFEIKEDSKQADEIKTIFNIVY